MRRTDPRWALVISMVSLLLISGMVSTSLASKPEPPPEGSKLEGPAVLAKVTLNGTTISLSDVVCKGQEQSSPSPQPYNYILNDITSAKDLIGFYIAGGANLFPQCFDFDGGLIGQAAHNFKVIQLTDGPIIQVDVVVLGVVSK